MSRRKVEWYADFETTGYGFNSENSYVSVWGISDNKGDNFNWGIDLRSFFLLLVEKQVKVVYFHNLKFDGDFIWKWLLIEGFLPLDDIDLGEDEMDLARNTFSFLQDQTRTIYSMTVNYEGHQVEFKCSFLILRTSISELGKTLGFPKGEYPYDQIQLYADKADVPVELVEYMKRDIDIARTALAKFHEIYDLKMTQAAVAQVSFEKFYGEAKFAKDFGGWVYRNKERVWHNVLTPEEWERANKAYTGGYTNFKEGIKDYCVSCPQGISIDINSSYPDKMRNYMLPYGELLSAPPALGNFITFVEIRIFEAELKDVRHPPILKDSHQSSIWDVKYLSVIGEKATVEKHKFPQDYTFVMDEFEYIKKTYKMNYEVRGQFFFKAKVVFKNWVDEIYRRKVEAENDYERQIHKLILNAKSGKDGQSPVKVNQKLVYDKDQAVVGKMKFGKDREWYLDTVEIINENLHYVPIIACITAFARIQLWEMINRNLPGFLYCDTDSMYSSLPIRCDPYEIDEERIGAWKPEYRFTKFKVLKTKCYMYLATHKYKKGVWHELPPNELVKKVAGLSKEGKAKIVGFHMFYLGGTIKNGKLAVRDNPTGKFLVEVDHTFKDFF